MIDSVRIIERFALDKGFLFTAGRLHVLNLFDKGELWTGDPNDIYLLHEFRRGRKAPNDRMRYEGNFYLVRHSDIDQNFFSEMGDSEDGKYTKNIEPLIQLFGGFQHYFDCIDVDLLECSFIDVTEFLDVNMDGIKIDYVISVPNYYTINNGVSS
jgi:hypothetical protein